MQCECKYCSVIRASKMPMHLFRHRPPQVGDLIFLDTPYRIYKHHVAHYLILEVPRDPIGNPVGFEHFTTAMMYEGNKIRKTPLNLKDRDGYWLLG